jgi:hypothetical protein
MSESKSLKTLKLSLAAIVLAGAACVPSTPLTDLPCPCTAGWVCCSPENVCVQEASQCSTVARPTPDGAQPTPDGALASNDAASQSDAGATTSDAATTTDTATTTTDGSADVLPVAQKKYRLVQTRSLASPLPDPTGIASDGKGFWILAGGSGALVHFNPDTGVTDKTLKVGLEAAGNGVFGLTWDGTALWISISGVSTNKLVRIDPQTGTVLRTMSSPTFLGPSDLDFDGKNLWLSDGTGKMFVIDPTTGGIQHMYPVSVLGNERDNGIAVSATEVWVGEMFGGMEVFDPKTGAFMATATHEDDSPFVQAEMGSTCFVGSELVMASNYGIRYFRADLVK